MKKYKFTFHFSLLSPNKSLLGIDYMRGFINDDEKFHEIYLGCLLFFVSFMITEKEG
jgi:hypothetical protein